MSIICPHCQAQNQPGVTRCWLCSEVLESEIVTAEVVRPGDSRTEAAYVITALLVIVALVAVGIGLWREAPGLSIMLLVVTAPAVLITLVRIMRRQGRGEKNTFWKSALDFILSALVAAAMAISVAAIAVVCFVGYLFVMCARMFEQH